jgi:hypothetical protein
MTMTRIEAIAASIAAATVKSYVARREDGIVTDGLQFGTIMRRHFLAAAKHHQLNEDEKLAAYDQLGWATERIKDEADKIRTNRRCD